MTLGEQQRLFAKLLGEFLVWTYENGMELSLGEAWRTPEQAQANALKGIGIKDSLHCQRLAIDLNLFLGGEFRTDRESYAPLGEKWKSLHPLARWGGDFKPSPDSDHFSLEFQGRK